MFPNTTSVDAILPPPEVISSLILDNNEEVIKIRRLRLANREPMAIQTSYLPRKFCSGIQEQDLTQSLTVILKDKYNLRLVKATQSLCPSLANDYESEMLRARKGAPVLIAERTSYFPSNRAAEFLKSVYRGDRYKFVVQLGRK